MSERLSRITGIMYLPRDPGSLATPDSVLLTDGAQEVRVKERYAASAGVTVPILNDCGRWTFTLTWVHCGPEAPYPALARPQSPDISHRWYPR